MVDTVKNLVKPGGTVMAKRGLNIYKRRDGRWEGRYKNGFTAEGKTRYSSVYGKSYTAVRELLERKRSEALNSTFKSCKCTVGEIIEKWIESAKNNVKESTLANYRMKLKKHILPYYSGLKYECLTADSLNAFISGKISENLSAKYVSDIVVLLKSAAKFAQRRYGYANKIDTVALPKSTAKNKKLLSAAEQESLKKAFLNKPASSNIGMLLAASTGIRIGELCALKWENIDLEKSVIAVRQTVQRISRNYGGTELIVTSPKSAASVREVPLPDFIIPYLMKIKAPDDCFLLSGSKKIVEPRTVQYRFASILKKAKLPPINFHALRHMFATNCIAVGFDVKTLSEILGHSSVKVTLDRYVHSSMERKKHCMKLFSDSFAA